MTYIYISYILWNLKFEPKLNKLLYHIKINSQIVICFII